jgi:SAM-dependent methyltransferase
VAKVWRRACADLAATSSGDAGGATLLDGTLEEVAGGDTAPAAPSGGGFGVVAAAQAWHWVDQQRGPALARRVMRPGGVLAAFWNTPLDGEGYESLIDVYRSLAPDMAPGMATSAWAAEMDTRRNVLARADGFDGPEVRHYDWAEPYGARALAELVQTYSGHRTLDPAVLERLTRGVADMVDRRPGGTVELGYRSVLLLARRVD